MPATAEDPRSVLLHRVRTELQRAEARAERLRALEFSLTLQERDARELVRDYEEVVASTRGRGFRRKSRTAREGRGREWWQDK